MSTYAKTRELVGSLMSRSGPIEFEPHDASMTARSTRLQRRIFAIMKSPKDK